MYGSDTGSWEYASSTIDWGSQVVEPLKALVVKVISFIPLLVHAGIVLLIGWCVARLLRTLIRKCLKAIQFDRIAEHTGIAEVLNENNVGMTPSTWVSRLFYWFAIFITWIMAFDVLKLHIPSVMLQDIGGFLSMLFMTLILLLLGLFFSVVISKFVETTAKKCNIANAGLQAGIIRWAIIMLTFIAVLARMGFPSDFLLIAMGAIGITLCVTFGIAFGIGGIQWAPKVLDKLMK